MKRSKNYRASLELFNKAASYDPSEAISLVKSTAKAKFDEIILKVSDF